MRKAEQFELDRDAFLDKNLALASKNIIDEYMENQSYARKSEMYSQYRRMNQLFTKLLGNVYMEDINELFVSEMLEQLSYKETLYTYRMILYLTEKQLIQDEKLNRLLDFKHRFYCTGNKEDFYTLMSIEAYDEIKKSQELTMYPKLIFANSNDIDFFDESDKSLVQALIDDTKVEQRWAPSVKINKCVTYKNMAKKLLKNKTIKSITRKDIAQYLHNEKSKTYRNVVSVFDFFMYPLIRECLNDDVKTLFRFYDFFCSHGIIEDFITLCETDEIEQYFVEANKKTLKGYRLCYTDVPYTYPLFQLLKNFVENSTESILSFHIFLSELYKSLGDNRIKTIEDFSFDSFTQSIKHFSKYNQKKYYTYLYSFFVYCYESSKIDFFKSDNIDIKILYKPGVINYLVSGYEIIRYNPIEPTPVADKWILVYDKKYDSNTDHSYSESITIDFTNICNSMFKEWVKYYVWKNTRGIKSKRQKVPILTYVLNYIDDLRRGKQLSIYCKEREPSDAGITIQEAMAVREYIVVEKNNPVTVNSIIYDFRGFLKFLNDTDYVKIHPGVFYHLYNKNTINNTSVAICDEHLEKLNKLMLENTEKGIMYEIFYSIFYIALETEFRISQIISLEKDCVHESVGKKNEYVILSKRKSKTSEKEEQAITIYVKKHIDHILDITKELRAQSDANLASYLFLVPQQGSAPVRKITRENFRLYLKKCCEDLHIPIYTAANIRDTHMTKAREMKIRNALSDVEHSVLTGHKTPNVDLEHYVDMSIQTMLEAVHGVIIGNVDLEGSIVKTIPDEIAKSANEVSDKCGYCNNGYCNDKTYLSCMVCKNFITMPSRLPYFEEQLKIIDAKIKEAKLPHDKEDYVNIKRLLVGYISAIMEFVRKEE